MSKKVQLGDIVVVRFSFSNGVDLHPAIVNRLKPQETVDVMVFPDNGVPYPLMNVSRFDLPEPQPANTWRWPDEIC